MRLTLPFCSAGFAMLMISFPGLAQETGEILRGQILASTCFTCHGTDGISPGAIPSIAGIPADSLRRTLQEFRDGRRPSTVMGRHASGYNDEEIASIADYLSRVTKEAP
ncbi:MAG: cytochrome c [Thiohalobacteraceae bacterium]